jgi:tRNA dimethylallyltransferase
VAVIGPTASGKSTLAEALADRTGADIVSVDSMQVYRGMDIGTAKPDRTARDRYGYHLIDLVDASEDLTVAAYQAAGDAVLDGLADGATPIVLVGGSGLHFRALVDPLDFPPTDEALRMELEAATRRDLLEELVAADPGAGDVVDLANPRRVLRAVEVLRLTGETPSGRVASAQATAVRDYKASRRFIGIGVDSGDELSTRVAARFDTMLEAGLVDEVAALAPRIGRTAAQAVGYKELLPVVAGERSIDEGRAAAIRATLALAKRQRTFFRRDPRIAWIPWHHDEGQRIAAAWSHLEGVWSS